ncbi:MAG: hypothetical protein H0U84_02490 [Thermoleophilaceae bacterium]|nr:hypothetical protein [Thermoleophilaceae bacterium]
MTNTGADRAALAQAVAAGVLRVLGVARLTGGRGVEAATYHPGGKVVGVVVRDDAVSVHVVARGRSLTRVVEDVRAATREVLSARGRPVPVEVVVEDLELDHLARGGLEET